MPRYLTGETPRRTGSRGTGAAVCESHGCTYMSWAEGGPGGTCGAAIMRAAFDSTGNDITLFRAELICRQYLKLVGYALPTQGAETFKGAMFHSGHWDHSVAYEGKRVGVIGSGCSAAQVVPAIAGKVSRLTLVMGKMRNVVPRPMAACRHRSSARIHLAQKPVAVLI